MDARHLPEIPAPVLIVAHGSPSEPAPQEEAIRALAGRVAARVPGWRVAGATLASPGALERAVRALGPGRMRVFPHFMADGWFVSTELPRRLAAAGAAAPVVLLPLGLQPGLLPLALARATEGARAHGLDPAATTVVVAAHGSPKDPRPARAALRLANALEAAGTFAAVRVGFVDEAPALADAAAVAGPALCLPFFATHAGHMASDVPQALEAAGFPGPLLPPLGLDRAVPALIAEALAAVPAEAAVS